MKSGVWRGVIRMQGQELPFTFDVENKEGKYLVYLNNASEKLMLDEVSIEGDSVRMILHIFDAELHAKVDGNSLNGFYFKNYDRSFKQAFTATFGDNYRFAKTSDTVEEDFNGKYGVTFVDSKNDTMKCVGIFDQTGNHVIGTFLTPEGDYRYLEGSVVSKKMYLSTFDGNHAFLFTAEKNPDGYLIGDYWSGKASHKTWVGVKNEAATMEDAEKVTYLKEGYDKITFSFPDVEQNMVSPSDEKFENKVLILQIFGTWCPNCMDETKFLTEWYKSNADRGIEILGLAYERKDDFAYASERVKKMKAKLGVPYDFVIAGVNDKKKAAETLPMLNHVVAFPTMIFIGRDGKVKHIHTGFEGPGTGPYYEKFKGRFNEIVNELLNEKIASTK
jgi:thiol-disulfide isomerase/thioredoxin